MCLVSPVQRFFYVYSKQSNGNLNQSEKYPETLKCPKKKKITVILPGDLNE